jgi:serine/threonine protein kinase
LKPENMLFTSDDLNGVLKIIDFGRSRWLAPKEELTEFAGSVRMMARSP